MVVIKRLMATMLVVGSLVSFSPVMAGKGSPKKSTKKTAKKHTAKKRKVTGRDVRTALRAVRSGLLGHARHVVLESETHPGSTVATFAGTGAALGSTLGPVGTGAGLTIGAATGAVRIYGPKLIRYIASLARHERTYLDLFNEECARPETKADARAFVPVAEEEAEDDVTPAEMRAARAELRGLVKDMQENEEEVREPRTRAEFRAQEEKAAVTEGEEEDGDESGSDSDADRG